VTPERQPEWVSDALVDLIVEAGIEHVAFNPGATFRGIHDSLANREGAPEIVLCTHEEIAVSLAHGYAKAAGRPMAVLVHDVVGLQHASMAIFNAWCDRVPILVLGGTGPTSTAKRRPWIDWIHNALVQGQQVRDYVKWDDQPQDAASIPMSFARAWRTAEAAPQGPVYLCLDCDVQEEPFTGPPWPPLADFASPSPPAPGADDVELIAGWLRASRLPLLVSDYAGNTSEGFHALVELAELAHAPVVDRGARLCFPSRHELNVTGLEEELLAEADAVIGIDVEDLAGFLGGRRPDRVADVTLRNLKQRGWSHDYEALPAADAVVTAAAEPTLRALVEALRAQPVPEDVLRVRRDLVGDRAVRARDDLWSAARSATAEGAVPHERVAAELWPLLDGEPFVLTMGRPRAPERRLWRFDRPRQHLGWHGGGGQGYGPGASIGAALALGDKALCIDLQPDGDLLYATGALWTAAHHRAPLLMVMLNNRQYGNTIEHSRLMAEARGRPLANAGVGHELRDPEVDFAALAQSFGVWSAGPITVPEDIGAAVAEAIAVVKSGRPALVEVITPGK
jgi:thiamine pyrophosphate-dependent acetolactate synthase large subunit-like protein